MIFDQLKQVLEEQKQNNPTPPVVEEPTDRVANPDVIVNKVA
jgi:hypothetical protein